MKKTILILMLALLLIGNVYALEFDNVKEYNAEKKEVTIKNSFGLGEDIAKVKLDTPLNVYVIPGKDRLVAQFTIENYWDKYPNALKKIEFFNINKEMQKISREFKYKYAIYGDVIIEDYENDCSFYDEKLKYNICKQIKKGEHTERKIIEWREVESLSELDEGNITIGIFTDVKKGDYVEWIPTIFGVKVEEWAKWTDGLNTGLISYYKLDESSGNAIDEVGGYDLTNIGSMTYATGLIGNSAKANQSKYLVTSSHTGLSEIETGDFTVSLWANATNQSGEPVWFGQLTTWVDGWGSILRPSGQLSIHMKSCTFETTSVNVFNGKWDHLVITRSGGVAKLYVNGTEKGSCASSTNYNISDFILGGSIIAGRYFDAGFDEVGIWNRSLSESEINYLYDEGTGVPYGEYINISINSPENNSIYLTTENIDFDINSSTTATSLENITLYINDILNETKTISGDTNRTSFEKNFSEGEYNWSVRVCDSDGDCLDSDTRFFETNIFIINSVNYTTPVLEGQEDTLSLNITTGNYPITLARLTYNNTEYIGSIFSQGDSNYIINNTINAPDISTETNITFYWNLTLQGSPSTYYLTSEYNQTITELELDDCSSFNSTLFNLTLYDEETQNLMNSSLNPFIYVDVNIYSTSTATTPFVEYSNNFTNVTNANVCINNNLTTATLYMDSKIQYGADNYRTEQYNIQDYTLTNSTREQNISLYDILTANSEVFDIIYKNDFFQRTANALVIIAREYVDEGTFKTVEAPITDSNGRAVASFSPDDTTYNIYVYEEGVLSATFTNIIATCQDDLAGECNIFLNALSSITQPQDYENLDNIYYTLTYDEDTRQVSSTFSTNDGSVASINLTAVVYDSYLNQTIFSDEVSSSSGTVSGTLPVSYDNQTVLLILTKDDETIGQGYVSLMPKLQDYLGLDAIVFSIIIVATIPMMFISSPLIMVMGGIIGVVVAGLLIFSNGASIFSVSVSLVWLIVAGAIIIWKINKGGRT